MHPRCIHEIANERIRSAPREDRRAAKKSLLDELLIDQLAGLRNAVEAHSVSQIKIATTVTIQNENSEHLKDSDRQLD